MNFEHAINIAVGCVMTSQVEYGTKKAVIDILRTVELAGRSVTDDDAKEAAKAIKGNWPSSNYTMLRKALTISLSLLREYRSWVNISDLDRQPDSQAEVFLAIERYDHFLGCRERKVVIDEYASFCFNNARSGWQVTHWKPIVLPEYPELSEEQELAKVRFDEMS